MSELKKAMANYFNGRDKIFELFGTTGWEEIDDKTEDRWIDYGDIHFFDKNDTEYSFENSDKIGPTVDGLSLYYIDEYGERFYALFSEDKKLTEDEYEKLEN